MREFSVSTQLDLAIHRSQVSTLAPLMDINEGEHRGRQLLVTFSPKSAKKLDRGRKTRLHKYAHYGLTTVVFEMDHPLPPHTVRVGGCLAVSDQSAGSSIDLYPL